jgi:dimethylargininase
MFTNAIVRRPCREMINGITKATLGKPVYDLVLEQHNKYVEALQQCGLAVTVLDADSRFPDSVFIEDTALCTPHCAIVTNPGAPSRNKETEGLKTILAGFYRNVHCIENPGTVDGGDVMMVGNHYYIGLSDRTNGRGAEQLIAILQQYGMDGSAVEMSTMLHLKTGMSYLEQNNLLITGEFLTKPIFDTFQKLEVPMDEAYAANSLWINDTVIVPLGYTKTLKRIQELGYKTLILDMSEFRKLDGGLSCLSLRF